MSTTPHDDETQRRADLAEARAFVDAMLDGFRADDPVFFAQTCADTVMAHTDATSEQAENFGRFFADGLSVSDAATLALLLDD